MIKAKPNTRTLLFTLPLSALEELIKETNTCGATKQCGRQLFGDGGALPDVQGLRGALPLACFLEGAIYCTPDSNSPRYPVIFMIGRLGQFIVANFVCIHMIDHLKVLRIFMHLGSQYKTVFNDSNKK